MNKKLLVALLAFGAVFQSCKKEAEEAVDNSTASALFGDWKFIRIKALVKSEATMAYGGVNYRMITTTDYASTTGGGIMRFDNQNAKTIDCYYNISGTSGMVMYENGVKNDDYTIQVPFAYNLPKASTESAYKAVGADSLYFPAGGLVTIADASGANGTPSSMPTTASGYKYRIYKGGVDTLELTLRGTYQQNSSIEGVATKATNTVNTTVILSK